MKLQQLRLCLLLVIVMGALVSGCSDSVDLKATLNTPVRMGVAKAGAATVFSSSNYSNMVQVKVTDEVAAVFNAERDTYWMGQTTNYIVAMGAFTNLRKSDGSTYHCYLLAFPKTASDTPIRCLSELKVGSFDPVRGKTNGHDSKYGVKLAGNKLFFVSNDDNNGYLYSWTEDAAAPTLLFTRAKEEGIGLHEVFVESGSATNVCVMIPAANSFAGRLLCAGSPYTSFSEITFSTSVLVETLQVDNLVVTTNQKLNLTNLAVSSRTANGSNGGLPSGYTNLAPVTGGGMVARAYAASITYFAANGDTTVLADYGTVNRYWIKVIHVGSYAWTYGNTNLNFEGSGDHLSRIDLSNATFDATNRIASTGVTTIADLSYAPNGNILVSGTDASGASVYALIDGSGNITGGLSASSVELLSVMAL